MVAVQEDEDEDDEGQEEEEEEEEVELEDEEEQEQEHGEEEEEEEEDPQEGGRRLARCLLCEQLCRPEADGCAPTKHFGARFAMLAEQRNYGLLPQNVVYNAVVETYNEMVVQPQRAAGIVPRELSVEEVREHFETHAWLVPRRIVGKCLQNSVRMYDFLVQFQLYSYDDATAMHVMDTKTITPLLAIQAKINDLVKLYADIAKRDARHVAGVELTAEAAAGGGGGGGGEAGSGGLAQDDLAGGGGGESGGGGGGVGAATMFGTMGEGRISEDVFG